MSPRADRILAWFEKKIAALKMDKGSADDAGPEEKQIAEELFEYFRSVLPKRKFLDLTQRERLEVLLDYLKEDSDDDGRFDERELYAGEDESGFAIPFEEIAEKAKNIQDPTIREEVEELLYELERVVDKQCSLMEADAESERVMRAYLEISEARHREREEKLELLEKRRMQIQTLMLIRIPDEQLCEQDSVSSESKTSTPAKTSIPAKTSTPAKSSPAAIGANSDALPDGCGIETSPSAVPVATASPAKTSAQSVKAHPEARAESNLTAACEIETSPIAFEDFYDDSDFEDFYAESLNQLNMSSPTADYDVTEFPEPPTVPQHYFLAARARKFGKFSQGQPQPSEQAGPTSSFSQPPYQSAVGPYGPETFAPYRIAAPQQPYSQYRPYYPLNASSGAPKPQNITGGPYSPYGSARLLPPYPNAQNQPAQNPGPWYYGDAYYPTSQWSYPYA